MFVMPCTPGAVDGGENAAQRCEVDVMINTNAEYVVAIVIAQQMCIRDRGKGKARIPEARAV